MGEVGATTAGFSGFLTFLSVLGCVGGGSACRFAGGASISVEGLFFDPIPIGFSFSGGLLSKVSLMFCFEPTTLRGSLGLEVTGA